MDELTTIARPYAKASFQRASETNSLSEWSNVLSLLAEVAKQQKVIDLLSSPTITVEQKVSELVAICDGMLDDAMARFLMVLAENKRLLLMPQINTLFEEYKARQERSTKVEVSTAFPLEKKVIQQLVDKLSANLDSKVNITVNINKTLIGGIVVRIGDAVIDGSVRGRLDKLAESIN